MASEDETPPHQLPIHWSWLKICVLGRHHAGGEFFWKIKWFRMPSPSSCITQSDASLGLLLFIFLNQVLHIPPSTDDRQGMINDFVLAIRSIFIDESTERVAQSSLLHRHPLDQTTRQVVDSSLLLGRPSDQTAGQFVDQVVRSSLLHQSRRQAVESRLLQRRQRRPSDDADLRREIVQIDSVYGSISGQGVGSSERQKIRVVVMRIWNEGEGDSSAMWGQEEPDRSSSIEVGTMERMIHAATGDGERDCPICLEKFVMGVELARTPCMHVFHFHCIDSWLRKSYSCPSCRFHMPLLHFSSDLI